MVMMTVVRIITRTRPTFFLLLLALVLLLTSTVIQAYVTHPNALPPQRQRQWLHKLTKELVQIEPGQLSRLQIKQAPDLMYAWSNLSTSNKDNNNNNNNNEENALAVESLVKRMIDERRAGIDDALLTTDEYNYMLEGWARSGLGVAAAERCEQILTTMQQTRSPTPNLSSFKAALMAWRQAAFYTDKTVLEYAPLRMQRILEWMIQLYQDGENVQALPDADCFDMVLQTWNRVAGSNNSNSNSASFGKQQQQQSSQLVKEAPYKAERLLGVMERLYESTGEIKVKPRTLSFNAVLAAWCKSVAAPDTTLQEKEANARRACDILSFMELLERQGDTTVAPDTASYSTVMHALVKTKNDPEKAARKADALLRRIEKCYAAAAQEEADDGEDGNSRSSSSIIPDTILFNTAMGCWAKSNVSGAYRRTRSILDRQIALHENSGGFAASASCKPDVFGYTTVISSCAAETGDKREKANAFNVALATFRQLQQLEEEHASDENTNNKKKGNNNNYDGPNHVTYGTMMKACAKLLPASSPLRRKWAKRIFLDCCKAGMVGDMVVSRAREALPRQTYEELLQGHSRRKLPSEWTRNVMEDNEFRKKKSNNNNYYKNQNNKKKRRRAEV